MNLKKWQIALAPVLSGILLGISQPLVIERFGSAPLDPTGLSGLLVLLAYVPVFLATQNASIKKAFWLGFTTSLIQYAIILYWFVIAMTVFGNIPIWFSVFVLFLACAILAGYIGFAFAVSQYLHRRFAWSFFLLLPATICSIEYLRNFIFLGGFPWGASGYALASIPVLLQSASLVGIYGLVFYVVLVNSAISSVIASCFHRQNRWQGIMLAACGTTVVFFLYGCWRLNSDDKTQLDSVQVALLQGNIEQGIKNKARFYSDAILSKYQHMQQEALRQSVDFLVWPEASFPLSVPSNAFFLPGISAPMPASIIGGVAYQRRWDEASGHPEIFYYNSAFLVTADKKIVGRFDKNHLVPFGEYVPWPFAKIANKVVPGLGVFARGQEFKPVLMPLTRKPSLSVGVTICYEGVFPEISREFVRNGAELLINLTNDAWYGVSSAPYQHLNMYRVRAVETGRSYVRATNTGVSAIIDSRGFIKNATPLYEDAVVTENVFIYRDKTAYLFLGDLVGYLSVLFVVFALVIALVGKTVLTRHRPIREWLLGFLGFGLMLWSHWYFSEAKLTWNEAAFTKDTFVTVFGFLVGCGALSSKPWGRVAMLWAGSLAMVVCTLIASVEGITYGIGSVIGLVVFLCARQQPVDRK
jgi:apolipoprotein N-acyltransferase